MTDRKKPGVAFWVTVSVAVSLFYVASIGPAWLLVNIPWVDDNTSELYELYLIVYRPVFAVADRSQPIHDGVLWYSRLFTSVLASEALP